MNKRSKGRKFRIFINAAVRNQFQWNQKSNTQIGGKGGIQNSEVMQDTTMWQHQCAVCLFIFFSVSPQQNYKKVRMDFGEYLKEEPEKT